MTVMVVHLVLLLLAVLDLAPPPGYPADFPYLPTHHGLTGQGAAYESRELCTVIPLAYDQRMATLRTRMRRALVDAGWTIRRNTRHAIDGRTMGHLIEARRGNYMVLAIFTPRGWRTTLQIYDCGLLRRS